MIVSAIVATVLSLNMQIDVAIVGLLNNNEAGYRTEINCFYNWCKDNALILNTKKTKEIIIDFRKNSSHSPVKVEISPLQLCLNIST